MLEVLEFSSGEWIALAIIAGFAGLVRGFSGFALSAVVMASAASFVPPVKLIPICWWLEISASVLMVRGGIAQADRRIVGGLVLGSAIGLPMGLMLTLALPATISKAAALVLLTALALMQLARVELKFLATTPGLLGSGVGSGIATGIAGVGGMVVALYVLVQNMPARVMRASLVMYLFLASAISIVTHFWFGTMDWLAILRGWSFVPITMIGVWLGGKLFNPVWEPYYKPFCLILLIVLAVASGLRLVLGV